MRTADAALLRPTVRTRPWRAIGAAGSLGLLLAAAPRLTGDDAELSILSGPRLAELARFALKWVLRSDDELFLRYTIVR